jgi:hypothetical protein
MSAVVFSAVLSLYSYAYCFSQGLKREEDCTSLGFSPVNGRYMLFTTCKTTHCQNSDATVGVYEIGLYSHCIDGWII